jgi:hypothetical protein
MRSDKAIIDRIAAVREALQEKLVAVRDGDDPDGTSAPGVWEQVLSTYVLAFFTAEVALELRTEGRGVQIINGEYPVQVEVRGRVNT